MKATRSAALAAVPLLLAAGGTAAQPAADAAVQCAGLRGMNIPAEAIGEPTTGADIMAAELVEGDRARGGGFCKVLGAVDPVDPSAPDINFQINLPLDWNAKAVQFGGGGYDGQLVTATGNVSFGRDDVATPLQRGYATFGSDSGHQSPSALEGSFMMNDEALANFGGLQIKKTRDVAVAVMERHYGRGPGRTYFQGNSQGGHEGLIAIQRWPGDYDGALVTHPANPFSALQLSGNRAGKALYQEGAWIGPEGVELLNTAVHGTCDGLDGIEDGLISNVAACNAEFDIEILRCADADEKECFNDAQIEALEVLNSRYEAPVELQGGATGFARWPIYEGADLYGLWGMGQRPEPSVPPTPVADFGLAVLADPMIRFAVLRDPDSNSLQFDPSRHIERIREISGLLDASDPDLSSFAGAGGKMLMMHGTTDFAITPHNSTDYYERVVGAMGQETVDSFMRYYLVPGFGHGSGRFHMRWDPLTVLENWVENGEAPGDLVTVDAREETAGRARPLCEYPAYPAYNEGADDPARAENFHCAIE